jgi:hypothetical protein
MSKTYRHAATSKFKYNQKQEFQAAGVDDHDGYKKRSRERKSSLVNQLDDIWKGVLSDKWSAKPERVKKIKARLRK